MKRIWVACCALLALAGCTLSFQPVEQPTGTAIPADAIRGIELIGGAPNTCSITDETQSTLISFDVIYHALTAGQLINVTLAAPNGTVLAEGIAVSDANESGEGSWGFYPDAYRLADDSGLHVTVRVHEGRGINTPVQSSARLVYNCTTGATISADFRQGE